MDQGAVEKIAELGAEAASPIVVDGVTYVRNGAGNIVDPRSPEPVPQTLTVYTLASLVEYLSCESEDFDRFVFLHVGPQNVRVVSQLFGRFEQRAVYLEAKADPFLTAFEFGRFMGLEEMVIQLQTSFAQTPELAEVLKVVGNVTDENVKNASDDGVSQTVTARAGIVSKAEIKVPNPVVLRPYRTFAEVEQPEGTFVLRMSSGTKGGDIARAALFAADGNAWKLKAVESIKRWLGVKCKEAGVEHPIIG